MIIPSTVLLLKTQNLDDSEDKYETLLKANNYDVKQINPLIFNFKNLDSLKKKLENSDNYSGLILSSPRCVQAVDLVCKNGNPLKKWKSKHNYCVGETTYKVALKKLGISCDGKESGNALNLSKVMVQNKNQYTKSLLFPHGNLKTDTLSLELSKGGIELEGVEVYDTIGNPNIERDFMEATNNFTSIPEFVVFFSPSGFSYTINLIQRVSMSSEELKFIAIGPVTETAILEKDFKIYSVAKQPNPESVLEAILNK